MEIKRGQWIFTREWQGPVLLVKGATAKRVTCHRFYGQGNAVLEPGSVLAVSDTQEGARAADEAYRSALKTYKAAELADIKARRHALSMEQYALEREIKAKATEAAQAAATSPSASIGGNRS